MPLPTPRLLAGQMQKWPRQSLGWSWPSPGMNGWVAIAISAMENYISPSGITLYEGWHCHASHTCFLADSDAFFLPDSGSATSSRMSPAKLWTISWTSPVQLLQMDSVWPLLCMR